MLYPTKKLWEICEILLWWTPARNNKIFWWWKNLWCSIADMKTKIITDTKEKITDEWVKKSNVKLLKKWTIFMSFKLSLWKLAFAWKDLYTNEAIAWLPIKDENKLDNNFIYYVLSWYDFSNTWTDNSVKWATLNKSKLENLAIPLPPLPTQKLIVQKLDSSFEKIDKSIELTKKNLQNLEQLNKSVLEEVFREWEYEIKTIDEISENVQYWYTWKTTEKWQVKYLRITDIQENKIIWEDVPYVKIEENETSKYSLNEWDIVFARTWATVWKSCLIDSNWIWNIFASYLIRIVWKKENINPNFMQYFFYSKNYWDQIWFDVVWAAQPNFNWTKLKQIKIPLPPLPKQKEIVTYLDKIFEKNKALKEKYEKKLKDLEELKQSLLKEAFEWRLVKE